jgi:hypothetical protein
LHNGRQRWPAGDQGPWRDLTNGRTAHDQLVYRFPRSQPNGRTKLRLTPLELIERLAALISPPRLHRHRYHGVLAPNATNPSHVPALRLPARYLWAVVLAHL